MHLLEIPHSWRAVVEKFEAVIVIIPKSMNFLVIGVIEIGPFLCNRLLMHVSETTHSWTAVVEHFDAVMSGQQFSRQRVHTRTYLQKRVVKYWIYYWNNMHSNACTCCASLDKSNGKTGGWKSDTFIKKGYVHIQPEPRLSCKPLNIHKIQTVEDGTVYKLSYFGPDGDTAAVSQQCFTMARQFCACRTWAMTLHTDTTINCHLQLSQPKLPTDIRMIYSMVVKCRHSLHRNMIIDQSLWPGLTSHLIIR
jgi:hypothetical protein